MRLFEVFAVMVAVPGFSDITTPSMTFATFSSLEVHIIFPSVLTGATLACSTAVEPSFVSVTASLSSVMLVAEDAAATVTTHSADRLPSVFAVITAFPSATGVTIPFAETIATSLLSLSYVTFETLFSGIALAVTSPLLPPNTSVISLLSIVMSSAACKTVTSQVSAYSLSAVFTVMVTAPAFFGVITPPETAAMLSSLLSHTRSLCSTPCANIFAVRFAEVSAVVIVSLFLLSAIPPP